MQRNIRYDCNAFGHWIKNWKPAKSICYWIEWRTSSRELQSNSQDIIKQQIMNNFGKIEHGHLQNYISNWTQNRETVLVFEHKSRYTKIIVLGSEASFFIRNCRNMILNTVNWLLLKCIYYISRDIKEIHSGFSQRRQDHKRIHCQFRSNFFEAKLLWFELTVDE